MTDTIGQQLKRAREARNLTMDKVVQATHIRAHQIKAIEDDDFESLPSPVQARAFLRLYAEFLGVSLDDLIDRQRSSADQNLVERSDLSPAPGETPEKAVPAEDEPFPVESNVEVATTEAGPTSTQDSLPPTAQETPRSQAIFTAIGTTLRQRRESLSLAFEEIERHTHVRKHYLLALENGEFSHLPSPVQARGMLSNYARFLDLDIEALLLQFAEGLQAQRLERQPVLAGKSNRQAGELPAKGKMRLFLRRYFSVDIFVGGGLFLLLLIFAIWGTGRVIEARSTPTLQSTAPSISDILKNTPSGGAATSTPITNSGHTATLPETNSTLSVTLPVAGNSPVQVVVVALNSAWVRVTVDGKVKFEERIIPGMVYSYNGNTQIEVLTGDGSAVSILYNQNDLGPMGSFGEVVDRIYAVSAILNPTPTFTPSPTLSPIPSATPRPSATLRPSATPRYSIAPTP